MSQLECKIELSPEAQQSEASAMTVGDIFFLRCTGDQPVFSEIELRFDLPPEQTHALHLLKTEILSPSQMLLTVTSYKPGQHQLTDAALISGNERIPVSPISFEVQSVIDPTNPPEKPYSSKGPIGVEMPIWFWLAIATPILLIALALAIKVVKSQKRKREVDRIKNRLPAIGAYQYFNKCLRSMSRSYEFLTRGEADEEQVVKFVDELDRALKDYLEFQFLIPAHGRGEKKVLKEIKSKYRLVTPIALAKFEENLLEMRRARASGSIAAQDCKQLFKESRESVSLIFGNLRSTQESA